MAKKEIVLKYPDGWRGIASVTTNENQQEEIWHPTENILVAVNTEKAGDPDYGTPVVDLKGNAIDPDRVARLQSAFRVIKYPEGMDNCAIAIQFGPSGKKDTFGYCCDRKGGGNPKNQSTTNPNGDPTPAKGNGIAIGKWSYFEGGPMDCGTGKCRHKLGEDDEGNPISSLHISTKALFRRDDDLDGPLFFENEIPPPTEDLQKRIPVHLSWDVAAKQWYWWTTSPVTPITVPNPLRPTDPNYPKVNIDPTNLRANVASQGGTTKPKPGTVNPYPDVATFDKNHPYPGDPGTISNINSNPNAGMYLLAFSSPALTSALAMRAQNYTGGQIDTGVFTPQTAKGAAKAASSPISLIGSAMAAQGGTTAASGGYGPSQSGAQGDPWNYNQQPWKSKVAGSKNSKYPGGTANGGIVFHPPETDLRDAATLGMQPNNTTLSTGYIMASPSVYFAAGTPQPVSGGLKDGYSWGTEAATGDLVFRSHANSQTPTEAIRLTKTAQTIRWKAGLSFYGELTHLNSANRVYTFPDKSGTVALTSDFTASQQVGVVTGDVNIASNTTLADVAGLSIAVAASETWAIRVDLDIGALLSTTGGKFAITVPAGATVAVEAQLHGVVPGTAKTYGLRTITGGAALDFTAANLASQTDGRVSMMVYVLNGGSAGNVTVQAAQSTSSLTNLTIRMGSQIVGTKKV